MKLYLSSIGIPDPQKFRALFGGSTPKIAVIANAWDVAPADGEPHIRSLVDVLHRMGFTHQVMDLKDFHTSPHDLKKALELFGGVWVMGGNTFYLRWCMQKAGFDEAIKPLLDAGLVYGGESAGAVVAGTSLRGIELLDNPHDAPQIIWQGLGLVDLGIIPHWDEQSDRTHLDAAFSQMSAYTKVITLNNDADIVLSA